MSPFCVAIDTPVWMSYGVCAGFQSQSESPHPHALSPVHIGFTSGVTPADLLAASMAAGPFLGLEVGSNVPLPHNK